MDSNRNHAFSEKLKEQVTASFERVRKALDLREKLLLRQLSVVVQQSHHVTFQFDNIKFVDGGGEEDLIGRIRTYGRYNIDNFNIILKDHYENEDYIQPVDDHDLMHKSCRRGAGEEEQAESEEIVVEFFSNKSLIKEGAEMVRESIINLALSESKELIDKSFGGGVSVGPKLEEELERMKIDLTNCRNREKTVTDSLSSQGEGAAAVAIDISNNNHTTANQEDNLGIEPTKVARSQHMITKASQTELDKAGRHNSSITTSSSLAPKSAKVDKSVKNVSTLTMNNCGGTINLKNVTNLTINTCSDGPAVKPLDEQPAVPRCPSEEGSPECGFYKRLITENKILRQHILKTTLSSAAPHAQVSQTSSSSDSPSTNTEPSPMDDSLTSTSNASNCAKPKRLPLTAAELRAVLNLPQQDDTLTQVLGDLFALASPTTAIGMASAAAAAAATAEFSGTPQGSQEHTMQIQQWLKQIISETETEPVQNADMMEFSHINN